MEIKVTTSDLVSVAQAARELGKHRATVYRWVEDGIIVGIKLAGSLFIPKSEVERLKNSQDTEAKG
jgi:excisionase family DNA binding protein